MKWITTLKILILLLGVVCPKEIWINNTVPITQPDGSQANPFNSFDEALPNIMENLVSNSVTVVFAYSIKPYKMTYMYIPLNGNYNLKLTSSIDIEGGKFFKEVDMPIIVIDDNFLDSKAQSLVFTLSRLNIFVSDSQAGKIDPYKYLSFDQFDSIQLTLENVKFSILSANPISDVHSSLIYIKAGSKSSVQMDNVIFNLNYTSSSQNILLVGQLNATDIRLNNISIFLSYTLNDKVPLWPLFAIQDQNILNLDSSIEASNIQLSGKFENNLTSYIFQVFAIKYFSSATFTNLTLSNLKNIPSNGNLIDADGIQNLTLKDITVSDSDAISAFDILNIAAESSIMADILVQGIKIEYSSSIHLANITASPRNLVFEDINIQNLTAQNKEIIYLQINLDNFALEDALKFTKARILNSSISSLLNITSKNSPKRARFHISEVYMVKNLVKNGHLLSLSGIDTALDNCEFVSNRFKEVSMIATRSNMNVFLKNIQFIKQTMILGKLLYTIYEPLDISMMSYFVVLIDSCIFEDIHSKENFLVIESPFLIVTNNIMHKFNMEGFSLLQTQGPAVTSSVPRDKHEEKLLYGDYPSIMWAFHQGCQKPYDGSPTCPSFVVISNNSFIQFSPSEETVDSSMFVLEHATTVRYMNYLLMENNTFVDFYSSYNLVDQLAEFSCLTMNNNLLVGFVANTIMSLQLLDDCIFQNNTIVGASGMALIDLNPLYTYHHFLISGNILEEVSAFQTFFHLKTRSLQSINISSMIISKSIVGVGSSGPVNAIDIELSTQTALLPIYLKDIQIHQLDITNYIPKADYYYYEPIASYFLHIKVEGLSTIQIDGLSITHSSSNITNSGAIGLFSGDIAIRNLEISKLKFIDLNFALKAATSKISLDHAVLYMNTSICHHRFFDISQIPYSKQSTLEILFNDLDVTADAPASLNSEILFQIRGDDLNMQMTNSIFKVIVSEIFSVVLDRGGEVTLENITRYGTGNKFFELDYQNTASFKLTNFFDYLEKNKADKWITTVETFIIHGISLDINICNVSTKAGNILNYQGSFFSGSISNVTIFNSWRESNALLVSVNWNDIYLKAENITILNSSLGSFLFFDPRDTDSEINDDNQQIQEKPNQQYCSPAIQYIFINNVQLSNSSINTFVKNLVLDNITIYILNLAMDDFYGELLDSRGLTYLKLNNISTKAGWDAEKEPVNGSFVALAGKGLTKRCPSGVEIRDVSIQNMLYYESVFNFQRSTVKIETLTGIQVGSNILANMSYLDLDNVIWKENGAFSLEGGFLALYNSTCNLKNSAIVNNIGWYVGGIFTDFTSSITIDNSSYLENYEGLSGKNLGSYPGFIVLETAHTEDYDPLLEKYHNFSFRLMSQTQNHSYYLIEGISQYALDTTKFYIRFLDLFNQTLDLDESVRVYLNSTIDLTFYFEQVSRGLIIPTSYVNLYGPGVKSELDLTIEFGRSTLFLVIVFIPRECMPGEYETTNHFQCQLCGNAFFSLAPHIPCAVCPSTNLRCHGGNVLNVSKDYWVPPNSITTIQCLKDTTRCKGGLLPDQCSPGYSGALCQGCDTQNGYTLSIGNQCKKCSTNLFNMLLSAGASWIGSYALELYFLYTLIVSNKNFVKMNSGNEESKTKLLRFKQKYYQGIQTRLFTNYSQFIYIIYVYVQYTFLQLIGYVNKAILAFSLISNPSSQQSSSLECIFLRLGIPPDELTYFKLKYWIAMPIVKIFLTIIILVLLKLKGKIRNLKNMIITSTIFILMNEQSGILLNLGRFSDCFLTDVVEGPGYVQLDPNIRCDDPKYVSFSRSFVTPAVLFWGVILPVGIFLILYISRHHLDNPEFRIKYGGIINSYRKEVYYWGLVTMLYKLCLLLTLILIETPSTAFFTALTVTLGYYFLFKILHPYSSKEFVNMENYSILTCILTLYLLGYSSSGKYEELLIGCAIMIVVTNLAMVFYFAKKIIARILENRKKAKHDFDEDVRGISLIEDRNTSLVSSLLLKSKDL